MAVTGEDLEEVPSGTISAHYATTKGPTIGSRHLQAIILSLAFFIGQLTQYIYIEVLIAMDWDISVIDFTNMYSAFIKGHVWLPVLAGFLAYKCKPKYVLLTAIVINSIAFILIPFAASTSGVNGVVTCRWFQGLSQGFILPCGHVILGKWAPPDERSTLTMIIYSGQIVARIVYSSFESRLKWSGIFYLYGALGLAWCVLYHFLGSNAPAFHPNISTEERCYIETSLEQDSHKEKNLSALWKYIMMVLPVLAIVGANISSTLTTTMTGTAVFSYLYLTNVLDLYLVPVSINAFLYPISSAIGGGTTAFLSDYLIRKNYITRLNSRRIFNLIASYGGLICWVLLLYVAKNTTTAVILVAISQAFYGAYFAGFIVNEIDLTPRFAGILRGISITISLLIQLYYVPLMYKSNDDNTWKSWFRINEIICFLTATMFACCASATKQKWDNIGKLTKK